jgi:hypothetical protein
MSWAVKLFGPELMVKDASGNAVKRNTDEALAGKRYVALYFSAHVSRAGRAGGRGKGAGIPIGRRRHGAPTDALLPLPCVDNTCQSRTALWRSPPLLLPCPRTRRRRCPR